LPVYECANNQYATARCRPEAEADNRVVAEGEDGYFSGNHGFTRGTPSICSCHSPDPETGITGGMAGHHHTAIGAIHT